MNIMWHSLKTIAKNRNLKEADFIEFAIKHESKYSILVGSLDHMVSTWYLNELIKDFKNTTK